jgi:hypothetical protein
MIALHQPVRAERVVSACENMLASSGTVTRSSYRGLFDARDVAQAVAMRESKQARCCKNCRRNL